MEPPCQALTKEERDEITIFWARTGADSGRVGFGIANPFSLAQIELQVSFQLLGEVGVGAGIRSADCEVLRNRTVGERGGRWL